MEYRRVIPRDLFNESMLLKCIGRLIILNGEQGLGLTVERYNEDGDEFKILEIDGGNITIDNILFHLNRNYLTFSTTLNSRRNYPLEVQFGNEFEEVFTESGELTNEFLQLLEKL